MKNKTDRGVAEALGRAHAVLLDDLKNLEGAALPTSGCNLLEILSRLNAARTHIAEHFRFEERNGYMDTVRQREPRLEQAIQELRADHGQLSRALDAIIDKVKAAPHPGHALKEEIARWLHDVRRHERRENDLVQDAFVMDVAAED